MPTVNFMPQLNNRAHDMVTSIVRNSDKQTKYVSEFFKYANKNDVQGQALIAYFTKYNNLRDSMNELRNHNIDRYTNIEKIIDGIVNSEPEIKSEAQKFVDTLVEKYPKHLRARISAASQGAVSSDGIVKKSFGKRFMVKMNLFFDKLVEFCKPVE